MSFSLYKYNITLNFIIHIQNSVYSLYWFSGLCFVIIIKVYHTGYKLCILLYRYTISVKLAPRSAFSRQVINGSIHYIFYAKIMFSNTNLHLFLHYNVLVSMRIVLFLYTLLGWFKSKFRNHWKLLNLSNMQKYLPILFF